MRGVLVLFTFFIACIWLVTTAPAPDERQDVQFIKYNNDQELEQIQRQIIAQFEQLGGSSQFHQAQSASFVDPSNLKINI